MQSRLGGRLRLGAAGVALALPLAAPANSFNIAGFDARLDTTLSIGATFRMQDPDADQIGISNGGLARSANGDDGNLGFEGGDIVAAVAKATHDIELRRGNYGLFSRFSYFYDHIATEADDREARFDADGLPVSDREPGNYELGRRARGRLQHDIDLLDLFVFGRFRVADRSVALRFGNQVVNWGESTFIRNSINSINPIDVARFRAPGSELREALTPTPMLWGSTQLSNALSMELVWLTAFHRTEIDPRGSFFSTNDSLSSDGDKVVVTFGRRKDDNSALTSPLEDDAAMVWLPREFREDPEGYEQGGVAFRYFSQALGNTEFGLYYLHYHSRTPYLSTIQGNNTAPGSSATNSLNGALPTCSDSASTPSCRASYFGSYPGNINLFGLSFNTSGPAGIAIQGEYSYRPNQPVQISGPELVMAALGVSNSVTGQGFVDPGNGSMVPEAILTAPGTIIRGYERVGVHQAQMTLTKSFGPQLGANQLVTLGEVGVTRQMLPDDQFFAGPGVALPAPGSGLPIQSGDQLIQPDGAASGGAIQEDGFATRTSWGYRLVGALTYDNALGAANLSPRLVFAHDVNGVSATFNEDTMALTAGVEVNYLNRWQANLAYTSFFGGRTYSGTDLLPPPQGQPQNYATSANPNGDRDFLNISVSYAF